MHRPSKQQGFTLLEVMVALFILAVSAAALSRAVSQATESTYQLEIRQHAGWVAHNQLSLVLAGAEQNLDGFSQFAGQSFYWKASIATTELKNFRRITIEVSEKSQPDYLLAELTGFQHE